MLSEPQLIPIAEWPGFQKVMEKFLSRAVYIL